MIENENQVALQDTPNIETEQQKNTVQPVSPVQQEEPEKPETPEDINWRAFREGRKKDRLEREAAERKAAQAAEEAAALRAAMEAAFAKSPPGFAQGQMNIEPDVYEDEDVKLEKKLNKLLESKAREYEESQRKKEAQEYPQRLMQTYPDFNKLVTEENLDYLEYHYPEIARPLRRLGDGYEKWSDTYLAIKKFIPNVASAKVDEAKIDRNLAKPKSVVPSTSSPSDGVNRESFQSIEARRMARYEEMKKIMSGLG